MRKVLEQKRHEYDQAKFMLKKKRATLEQLQTELDGLKKDGTALGLDEYPDEAERLKPVKEISTRPVFTKHTVSGVKSPVVQRERERGNRRRRN